LSTGSIRLAFDSLLAALLCRFFGYFIAYRRSNPASFSALLLLPQWRSCVSEIPLRMLFISVLSTSKIDGVWLLF
jgi:hypothetical protein